MWIHLRSTKSGIPILLDLHTMNKIYTTEYEENDEHICKTAFINSAVQKPIEVVMFKGASSVEYATTFIRDIMHRLLKHDEMLPLLKLDE